MIIPQDKTVCKDIWKYIRFQYFRVISNVIILITQVSCNILNLDHLKTLL